MDIELQRGGPTTLARQIYLYLRGQIASGRLGKGEKLPSTRNLACHLTVSRNTVSEAYEMLLAEGFAESRPGAPTRVAGGWLPKLEREAAPGPVKRQDAGPGSGKENEKGPGAGPGWDGSQAGMTARTQSGMPARTQAGMPARTQAGMPDVTPDVTPAAAPAAGWQVDFGTGQPDLCAFPKWQWLQLLRQQGDEINPEYWGYSAPEGLPELRAEISAWLLRSRGMWAAPESIFITAGATGALHILAGLLSARGRRILIEDPCHTGMLRVLQAGNYQVIPVPVDEQGLRTEALEPCSACAIYVTPSHQFPLGAVMPAGRRADLVRYARSNDLYIIEDDYDSEFRYCGAPISPLYTMDQERTIYVGTFSKIMYPALRIGYVVLPVELRREWLFLRRHTDVQNTIFEQAALAAFMKSRKLDRHVRNMRKAYGQRRKCLLEALEREFGPECRIAGDAAGLHLAVAIPGLVQDRNVTLDADLKAEAAALPECNWSRQCREAGINVALVEDYAIVKGNHPGLLLLGYGHLAESEIAEGLNRLHGVLDRFRDGLESGPREGAPAGSVRLSS